ncbi:hypothetical protein IQ247_05795 [Plectonema cf. radiosum LEGE 06105]|uniref:Uncharacterized protein n=1 Tax=Plectonema cf. radiosum LEGE 06105 TaxID=945769 RepID=A0A8J7JZR0_9CYAN|nr:hypothetical protein [Plectonema radiosum]MBE9212227.1 hypothetical protein [Plectonema cf. radiosum LEGE 06105]
MITLLTFPILKVEGQSLENVLKISGALLAHASCYNGGSRLNLKPAFSEAAAQTGFVCVAAVKKRQIKYHLMNLKPAFSEAAAQTGFVCVAAVTKRRIN